MKGTVAKYELLHCDDLIFLFIVGIVITVLLY